MGGCNLKNPQREVAAPAAPTAPPLPPPVAEKEEELPAPAPAPAPGPAPAPAPGPAPAPVPQPIGVTSDNEEDLEEDFDDYGGGGGGDDDAPSATRPTHTPLKAWEMEFFLAGITPKNTAEAEAEPAVALPPTTKHTDGDFHSCSHCFRGSISPEQAVQGAGSVIQQVSYLMTSAFHATVPEVCAQAIVEVSMTPVTCDYKCFNTVGLLWSLVKGSGTSFKTSNSLGKAIARNLPASDIIESTSVTDLGFVNIVLSNSWIAKRLQNMLVNGIQSWAPILPVKRVVLDSSSPSIANEMHVGHLRPTIIGDALARMFEFSNVEVLRYNYVGDYDTKFGMLLEFLFEKYPNWEQLGSQAVGNLEDFYKASKQRFDEDAEFKDRAQQVDVQLKRGREEKYSDALKFICETRRNEFDQVYKLLDVQLEEKVEDFYVHHISQVLGQLSREKKLIKEIKGDRVIFIEGYQSPLLLFKRDGSCRYALTELAALSYWLNVEKVEWIIYVTDVGRWQTFDKFFKVARMAGWLPDPKEKKFPKTSHAELGLVLGADGKREGVLLRDLLDKAKTRSKKELIERFTENGKIVDWTDEELERASEALGYGAVNYVPDLKNDGVTNYTRSLDGMLSDMGNTAVYLQYALAHVCSIIRKSNMDVEELKASGNISLAHQDERDLGLHLIRYAEAVEDGCTKLLPSVVCEYLYKLSRIYTTFCANCPMVVGSPEEASRLMLCEATAIVMRQCFELLGITPVYKL